MKSPISTEWTPAERLHVIERLTGAALDVLLVRFDTNSLLPARILELAHIVASKPADQLQVRRDEILRALADCDQTV